MYKEGKYDSDAAARGIFDDTDFNSTGWYNLQIEGKRGTDALAETHAAGYIEGIFTASFYKNHRNNVYQHLCSKYIKCEDNYTIPKVIRDYFKNNYNWVKLTGLSNPDMSDPWYFAAATTMAQIEGMVEAYNKVSNDDTLTIEDLWMFMSHASIYDIARAQGFALQQDNAPLFTRRGTVIVGRTSSLDNVFIGQTAWRTYGESVRIAKRYRLRYNSTGNIVDRRSLSSYPFMLHSDDEFCISDMGLAITSTSIITTNDYAKTVQASFQGYPYWFRNIVATLASHSAGEWFDNYKSEYSTGTGIEYILLDIKKFKYKEGYQDEFVLAVDEIPGQNAESKDMTSRLIEKRFVGSYDVPVVESIFKTAGYDTLAQTSPEWYSYENSARAKILQRTCQSIYDDDKMKTLIRLNDKDRYSEQGDTTTNAIAGRFELIKPASDAMCFGAFDAKFTSIPRMLHSEWVGQVGASYDNLPQLNLLNADACDNSDYVGVDTQMYNGWVDQYFDIEID